MKTHFVPASSPEASQAEAVCGRMARFRTAATSGVTCKPCQGQPEFRNAKAAADKASAEAFFAQEPKQVKEPWREGHIVCSECSGTLFRMGSRTCMGHYQDYVCAACGHAESRLTETGMSF